jgi:hypothetical protein
MASGAAAGQRSVLSRSALSRSALPRVLFRDAIRQTHDRFPLGHYRPKGKREPIKHLNGVLLFLCKASAFTGITRIGQTRFIPSTDCDARQLNLNTDSYFDRSDSATCSAWATHSSKSYIMTSGKLLSAGIALAAVVGTPAFATTVHKAKTSHAAYASQTQPDYGGMIIGWDGRLLGTDPDPNIRFQLMRDQSQGGD